MTNKTKDGGSFYPIEHDDGMTLRQYYAGHALMGLLASVEYHNVTCYKEIASDAFMAADAMIAHEEAEND